MSLGKVFTWYVVHTDDPQGAMDLAKELVSTEPGASASIFGPANLLSIRTTLDWDTMREEFEDVGHVGIDTQKNLEQRSKIEEEESDVST